MQFQAKFVHGDSFPFPLLDEEGVSESCSEAHSQFPGFGLSAGLTLLGASLPQAIGQKRSILSCHVLWELLL